MNNLIGGAGPPAGARSVKTYTSKEVAAMLRVTTHCLANWRREKKGPPWVKVSNLVRYPANRFHEWWDRAQKGE
jgi:hypothetical protein